MDKSTVMVSFLCSKSLPVKARSLDSVSDNFSFIEFDDDWDDSSNVIGYTKREEKIKKWAGYINSNMCIYTESRNKMNKIRLRVLRSPKTPGRHCVRPTHICLNTQNKLGSML